VFVVFGSIFAVMSYQHARLVDEEDVAPVKTTNGSSTLPAAGTRRESGGYFSMDGVEARQATGGGLQPAPRDQRKTVLIAVIAIALVLIIVGIIVGTKRMRGHGLGPIGGGLNGAAGYEGVNGNAYDDYMDYQYGN
jgi:hypothetical protein